MAQRDEAVNLLKATPEGMMGRGVYELGKSVIDPAERYYRKAKKALTPEPPARSKPKPKLRKRPKRSRKY